MPARRPAAALCALYTLVVASGAPLPVEWVAIAARPSATAERFPCEACPCGCGTAERCWDRCCCHTLPQRLDWARREGVRPPEAALDRAARRGLDVSLWRPGTRPTLLPVVEVTHEELEEDPASLPPCCRAARARLAGDGGTSRSRERCAAADPGVSLLRAAACQGLVEAWLALGEAPLPAPVELVTLAAAPARVNELRPLWRSHADAPDAPPPDRLARV